MEYHCFTNGIIALGCLIIVFGLILLFSIGLGIILFYV